MAKKKTYTAAPGIPSDQAELFRRIVEVQAGSLSVSEAARQLGISRNHFQTLMHRGIAALVEAISPQPPGRRPRPEREAQLEEELARAERENARLQSKAEMIDRMLELAGSVVRGGVNPFVRGRKKKATDEDPPEQRLAKVRQMRAAGIRAILAAALVGTTAATVRRWNSRDRDGKPLCRRPGPAAGTSITEEQRARLDELVRDSDGQMGADSLRHAVAGVSRRVAAVTKRQVRRQMERERRAACTRIRITAPGVMRGFDQIEQRAPATWRFLLRCADASVPYTTTLAVAGRYDADAVVEVLEHDWVRHGAPYVLRLDRAAAHLVEPLRDLADAHGVLLLHGPAYYPAFYGQLEHGNRFIRALLLGRGALTAGEAAGCAGEVRALLNDRWPRRSLGFQTPAALWSTRPQLVEDRSALRAEVADRAERLRWEKGVRGGPADLAERLAIEQALTARGWMRREPGGWC